VVWLGVLLVAALAAVGCTDDDDSGGASAPTTVASHRGGVLRIGLEEPRSLVPADAETASETIIADLLYDGLTRLDPDTGEPNPALARSWTSSAEDREFTFVLDGEAAFANGSLVTAADVVASLQRAIEKPFPGSTVAAVGSDRVNVTMVRPLADLPLALAAPRFGIAGAGDDPASTGPFKLASRDADGMSLVRDGNTLLDGIDVTFASPADALAKYQSGDLDWAIAAAEAGGPNDRAVDLPAILFYGLNLRHPALADVRVRQAIVHAVNRGGAARAGYGPGRVVLLNGVVPPDMAGGGAVDCGERCTYDPDAARRLLAEAAPGGIGQVPIDFDDFDVQQRIAKAIMADLQAIGVDAVLRPHAPGEYPTFLAGGTQGIFRLGWVAAWPAASGFLPELFGSQSPINVVGFANADVDARIAAVLQGDVSAADEVAKAVLRAAIVIPIAQFREATVQSARVNDLALDRYGSFDGSVVWLDT
jgi:peptide/nickel transport system substrate-binding protein